MDSCPRGAQVDYEKMVQNVMQKVFYDHVSLFKFDDEDEPLASELFTLGFDKDSPGQSQGQGQGQSQSQEEKERKDLNPARRPQRLYLRRERAAMPKAMTLLQETAFLLLSEEDKETIVDAIRSELNYIM